MYNVKLAGDADAFFLRDLEQQMSLDFWTALPRKGEVKVMVSPSLAPVFELVLRNRYGERMIGSTNQMNFPSF